MSSLSVDDIRTLQRIGHDTIHSIVALCVETVLWTIYLVLVVIAGNILLRKRRIKMSLLMFLIVLVMFFMDTAIFFIDVNNAVKEISLTLTSHSDLSLHDRYGLTFTLPWPVESVLYAFMSNLGDVIVIWRVHAFYSLGNDHWILLIPLALLAGSFVTSGLIAFCVAKHIEDPAPGDFDNPAFCKHVQLSSYVTTLATTGVATLLISYKTWQYRRSIGRHLRGTNKMTKCERVMAILIESGIIYFFFFLEAVVTDSGNIGQQEHSTPALAFASIIWTYMTSHILGIYPVIIVILVHSQRSYIQHTTTWTTAYFEPPSGYSHSAGSQRIRSGSRGSLFSGQPTHPIEFSMHALRQGHDTTTSLKSMGEMVEDGTAVAGKEVERKLSDRVA